MPRPSEEIKEKLDLVEFIKGYIDLQPAGKNFKAICPFHQEKTPSFMVSPDRQIWHCFGCGEGGDIFKFLMRYENLEFYEALRVLAEKAGVELKHLSPEDQKQFGVLYDLNLAATEFFEDALKSSKKAQEYVKERGLKEETMKDFMVGFAPNGMDELTVTLINKGFAISDIVRAGLAIKTERGRYLDRFRGRLMFPIHNHFGKVVGFSGRILPELDSGKSGKYINSPDTPIFNKSRLLYGFWQSKRSISEENKALLVEGQMDFLLVWQDGVRNVVATSGTALTSEHLRALRRVTNRIVMAFDRDEAGAMAAERSIDMAGAHDFTVYAISLGKFEDPAEAALKNPGFIKKAMDSAKTGMEYYFERYLTPEALATVDKEKLAIRAILLKISDLWSPVERSHWIRELSHRTGVRDSELTEELEGVSKGKRSEEASVPERSETRKLERKDIMVEEILSFASGDERFREKARSLEEYIPEHYREAFAAVVGGAKAEVGLQTRNIIDLAALQAGFLFEVIPENKLETEFSRLAKELALECLREKRAQVGAQISTAEARGDEKRASSLLKEFDGLLRKMQDIENNGDK